MLMNGTKIYGGFAGTETDLAQRDPKKNLTVLTGDLENNDTCKVDGITMSADQIVGTNSAHVVMAGWWNYTAAGCVLDGVVVTGGSDGGLDTSGGGLIVWQHASVTINDCKFIGNKANFGSGGGVYVEDGTATITNCEFVNNKAVGAIDYMNAPNSHGGGLLGWNGSQVSVSDSTFVGNLTSGSGGGASISTATSFTNCTFDGNTAPIGSAINVYADARLMNCTITKGTTISHPSYTAEQASAICVWHIMSKGTQIANTILWSDEGIEIYNFAEPFKNELPGVTVSYSVVQNGEVGTGTVSNDIVTGDPKLASLADNGGYTRTCALQTGSSAIDAGTSTGAPSTDQRGISRPQGSGIDIGAYEVSSTSPTPQPTVAPTGSGGGGGGGGGCSAGFGVNAMLLLPVLFLMKRF